MLPFKGTFKDPFKGFGELQNAFQQIESEIESAVTKGDDHQLSAPGSELEPDELEPAGETAEVTPEEDDESTVRPIEPAEAIAELKAKLNAALLQNGRLEAKVLEKAELCAEKDAQIAAVLEEGELLSMRQAEQEKTIRKLRLSTRDAQQVGSPRS